MAQTLMRTTVWTGLAALAVAGGCGTQPIRGAVVAGPIGRAMVVDARDERLAGAGVAGVTVKAVRPGRETSGATPLAVGETDADGRFALKLDRKDQPRGPVVIVAEGEDVYRTTTTLSFPRTGQELLVQVRERRRVEAGGSAP